MGYFKLWRRKIGVVALVFASVFVVVMLFLAGIANTALKAEERLIGVVYTVKLVEKYMEQTQGQWPTSWEELDSTEFENGYLYDSKIHRGQLRQFAVIEFESDLQQVAEMTLEEFTLIRPNGPCSRSYLIQVEQLISTAKKLQASKELIPKNADEPAFD